MNLSFRTVLSSPLLGWMSQTVNIGQSIVAFRRVPPPSAAAAAVDSLTPAYRAHKKRRQRTSPPGTSHFSLLYPRDWQNPSFQPPGMARTQSFQLQVPLGLAGLSHIILQHTLGIREDSIFQLFLPLGLAALSHFSPQICWGLVPPKRLVSASHRLFPGDWYWYSGGLWNAP